MKSVKLYYYAVLREYAGISHETRQTGATTFRELYEELSAVYKFPLDASRVRVAVSESYAGMDQLVDDGAEITFIPPVAGG